jgi:serpin B
MKRFVLLILLTAALPAADPRLTPAMNAFTTAAYNQLSRGDGNLILSPFNIATALSMVLAGARGHTSEEIQSVLQLHYDSTYDAAVGALLADLTKAGNTPGNELHTANGLWVQKGFTTQPAFQNTLTNNYHAPLTPLDFIANPEAARSQINRWTEEHTGEKIKNLFPAGALDAHTRLVLTSAIYFYGKWQDPFVISHTQPASFSQSAGATTRADFMNQTSYFAYAETPSAQILEMPYAGSGFAFDILLPKTVAGLPGLEKSLTPESLAGWLGNLATRNVQVSLPKFRVESEFSLRKGLSAMGMPTAFTSKADFSGIDPKRGLEISAVVHKAFVDVSEHGTEAAAATGIAVRATAMRMPEPAVVFRADHPFLFLIRDTRTGVMLFIGRLTNPQ